ncbi:hypothetical protein JCM2811A_47170 [Methylorubrum rhodinum]
MGVGQKAPLRFLLNHPHPWPLPARGRERRLPIAAGPTVMGNSNRGPENGRVASQANSCG